MNDSSLLLLLQKDFGYEVIEQITTTEALKAHQDLEDQEDENLAEQYKGTPPLKTKKKKLSQQRTNHEVCYQVFLIYSN